MKFKELIKHGQNRRKILKHDNTEIYWNRQLEMWCLFPTTKAYRFKAVDLRHDNWELNGEWERRK